MRLIILFITISMMAVVGCSRQSHPDPQLEHLRLVGNLFNALQKNDHRTALVLIGKLKAVIHDNSFLSALEDSEIGNIYIAQAQEKLDHLDITGAIKAIEAGLSEYPLNQHLLKCKQDLHLFAEFKANIAKANNPQGAAELKTATERLNVLTTEYPSVAEQVKPFIVKKMQDFAAMETREQQRALQSLKLEHDRQLQNDAELAKIIAAQIEYEKDTVTATK